MRHEAERLRTKLEAGANFVMTQPIFDPAVWRRFLDVYGEERLPVPVLIGILPLQSTKHAEFLNNEVPGITLTDGFTEGYFGVQAEDASYYKSIRDLCSTIPSADCAK